MAAISIKQDTNVGTAEFLHEPAIPFLTILKNPKRTIFSQSNEGKPPSVKQASAYSRPVVRHYVIEWDSMIMNNGDLKRWHRGIFTIGCAYKFAKNVMYHMHNSAMSGHLGQNKIRRKPYKGIIGLALEKTSISGFYN
ncbi:LOW QUALITY PROTEIN: hypothetical protein MAR_017324, partial [Mya arenaria]